MKSKLSEKILEKARRELGENDTVKSQAVEQLRNWIKSQPNIKNCRQGGWIFDSSKSR
jgi:hypothetical protein